MSITDAQVVLVWISLDDFVLHAVCFLRLPREDFLPLVWVTSLETGSLHPCIYTLSLLLSRSSCLCLLIRRGSHSLQHTDCWIKSNYEKLGFELIFSSLYGGKQRTGPIPSPFVSRVLQTLFYIPRNISYVKSPSTKCHAMFRWWQVCPFPGWCTSLQIRPEIKAGFRGDVWHGGGKCFLFTSMKFA